MVVWLPSLSLSLPPLSSLLPLLSRRLSSFICESLANLAPLSPEELVAQRYERFRGLGSYDSFSPEERKSVVSAASAASKPR